MKILLTFFMLLGSYTLSAQLQTKWNVVLKEPLNPPNSSTYSVTPYEIINDNDKTIFVNSITRGGGWQIAAINTFDGSKKWTALRNYRTPTLDSVQYFPGNLTTDENQNIVELGIRAAVKYPKISADGGSMAKAVYDKNTGKELSYIDHIDELGKYFYIPGQPYCYSKSGNGKYYYLFQSSGNAQNRVFLRRIDAKTFSEIDTIHRVINYTSNSVSGGIGIYNFGENKLYYSLGIIDDAKKDTSRYKTFYVRMDSTGKETHERLNISNYFYYYPYVTFWQQCSDGFIIGGSTDSTQLILSGNESKKLNYVMKIDTSGKLLWRTWYPSDSWDVKLPNSLQELGNQIYLTKAEKDNRYGKKELIILNLTNGKIKNVGEFKIKNETREYFLGYANSTLPNRDYVFSYFYKECQIGSVGKDVPCFGIGLISNEDIAKITDTKEENILTENISVYPNPVENRLQVLLPTVTAFEYVISDMMGRTVKTESVIATNFHEIAMQDYPKGVYLLSIKTTDNQVFVQKIVKQ